MTAQELLDYRHEPYRQELIDGKLYEMEPPGAEHGVVVARIASLLDMHVRAHGLGQTFAGDAGFQLASDPDTVRGPDAAFVLRARMEEIGLPTGYFPGPPDLAVEVVSPNDRHSKVVAKALAWLDAGALAVLVADPGQRTAAVYRSRSDIRVLELDETLDLGDVVTGFETPVAELFA